MDVRVHCGGLFTSMQLDDTLIHGDSTYTNVSSCIVVVLCCVVVVLGHQAVCHARIMRRWSSNLVQWKIQP